MTKEGKNMAEEQFDDFDNNVQFDEDGAEVKQEQAPVQAPPVRRLPPKRPNVQAAIANAEPRQTVSKTPVQQAVQKAEPAPAQTVRYVPYEIPKKIGIFDRQTGAAIIEDEDMLRVIMAQLVDLKNDLEEIKSLYS